MTVAQPPVFVDDTGRRRILTRRAGRVVVIGFTAYLGLVALGLARDPKVGPIQLPTFGLPSLGLMIPPAPTVLGEQATRTASEEQVDPGENGARGEVPSPTEAATAPGGGTTTPEGSLPRGVSSPAAVTAGRPAPPGRAATSPTTGPPASTSSTSTPSSSTSTTSSTTTQTTTNGQGQGQGSGTAATKGPDGSGPPGQLRKSTTTTAG